VSNTSITPIQITDTFQVWINKTNEIIDLANENVMLAGPGPGFTVQGNSTLLGTFNANTITANTSTITSLSVINITRAVDANENILSNSPVRISSGVENILDLQTTAGNRPILRMINGANARWTIQHDTSASNASISIKTEGASTPQVRITQAGRLVATQFEGDGSLITNIAESAVPDINANKITSGVLDVARIPDLNANKITSGVIANPRLPDSATRTEISLANLTNAASDVQGFISGRRFRSGLTWNNVADKPSTFPPSAHTHAASEIVSGTFADARLPANIVRDTRTVTSGTGLLGGGALSSNLVISANIATQAEAEAATINNKLMTPLRTAQAIAENVRQEWQFVKTVNLTETFTFNVDVDGLGDYRDIWIIADQIEASISNSRRALRVGNASEFLSTPIYQNTTGAELNRVELHNNTSAGPRSGSVIIYNFNTNDTIKPVDNAARGGSDNIIIFIRSSLAFDRVRVFDGTGGQIRRGRIFVFGKK
jgi:hypothetical protein